MEKRATGEEEEAVKRDLVHGLASMAWRTKEEDEDEDYDEDENVTIFHFSLDQWSVMLPP